MDPGRILAFSSFANDRTYSNVPVSWTLAVKARFGGQLEPIIKARPAAVILSSYNRSDYRAILEKAGIRFVNLPSAHDLAGIKANVAAIAHELRQEEFGKRLIREIEQEASTLRADCAGIDPARLKATSPPTYLQFYPANGTISGAEGTFSEISRLACGQNLGEKLGITGWPKLSQERLLSLNPSYLVIGSNEPATEVQAELRRHPQWARLPAVREGRVLIVPDRLLSSQSQHILKAAKILKEQARKNSHTSESP